MTIASTIIIFMLLTVLTIASYVDALYSEMGKFLAREFQENIDAWEKLVEPRLGMSRERIRLSAAVLTQFTLGCLALEFGALLFDRTSLNDRPTFAEISQAVLGLILVIILFNRMLPLVFFVRTRGVWVARWRRVLQFLFYMVTPITLLLSFLLSIAALTKSARGKEEESPGEAVEALIEAGQEEGILEESDRDLVRSAVEFGDKLVRDVMTPRPEVFAVPRNMTIEEFLRKLSERPFSRVPVYDGTIDHVTGIAFSHDLLQITDDEAHTRTVESIERPAAFVPETKKVNELLREMQREKQHMSMVIDEYGGVAGVVTIEDLLEQIVGTIADEHEEDAALNEPRREADGVWIVPGNLDVERLESLFGNEWSDNDHYEAQTAGGLVSEAAGRIPLPGEVVEVDDLRFEVVASTDRRIERLRVTLRPGEQAALA